ncbi:hypothetical protein BGP77_10690 [Saccharospirillum sp. MSK14-1]|uniref:type IV pilus modification PilV family protein n=1 Tax=Saccharospirillum sp. MSK14-1 TaxID=1897632 RepID=UPI000D3C77BA|nr:hypothetical protein [Saccharospirillum sp. MSK14-1]PTY38642.1 hypothetical protein BGP77_10690 [Saccharospirillum sp. MSK14-1]
MTSPKHQQGFTLVAVIFLIVVLGGALTLMATLSSQSSGQFTQNLLQSRARYAALAGLEWGTQQLVIASNPGNRTNTCNGSLQTNALPVPAYANVTVSLSCVQRQYGSTRLFDLTARAEYGQIGNADYVWTEQNATLEF